MQRHYLRFHVGQRLGGIGESLNDARNDILNVLAKFRPFLLAQFKFLYRVVECATLKNLKKYTHADYLGDV